MKVALVTHFPEDPGAPRGGVEAVSVNLAKALSGFEDLKVHVVTGRPGKSEAAVSEWGKVTIHRVPLGGGSILLNAIGSGRQRISAYLTGLAPDLVHAHDTFGLMVKGLPIPRVFTIHGFIYGDTLVSGQRMPRFRSAIWRLVETSGWAEQPRIISISPYVRERLTGIATGVIHDIDNPISEDFFRIGRNERKGTVFSAAVISPRKNTLGLVEAVGILLKEGVDVELRLAGSVVEPDYGRRIEDRVRELGLERKVLFLGRIGTSQIRKELSESSIFALVSLEENSPMGIEEAMAAGVTVITSNCCGMPYMVRHSDSGFLVNPGDPGEIARRIRQLLEDDELRERFGRKSREIAFDRFHPDVVARRTREVYLEVLTGSNNFRSTRDNARRTSGDMPKSVPNRSV